MAKSPQSGILNGEKSQLVHETAKWKLPTKSIPRWYHGDWMGIGCSFGFLWTISLGSSAVLCGGDLTYLVNHVLDLVYGIPIIRSNSINLQFLVHLPPFLSSSNSLSCLGQSKVTRARGAWGLS